MKTAWSRVGVALLLVAVACGEEAPQEHAADRDTDRPAEGADRVRIAPSAVERTNITLDVVETGRLTGGVSTPAELQYPPGGLVHVSPIVSGQLAQVSATVGDHVEKGQRLAVLQSVALGEARSALQQARAAVQLAEERFERQQMLMDEGIGARREYQEARAALEQARARRASVRRRLGVYGQGGRGATLAVHSPITGIVSRQHAATGEVVGPDQTLFEIGNASEVWAVGRVYPQDVGVAKQGSTATLTLRALPGQRWKGTLGYVAPALDPDTRTLEVRMTLSNPDGTLRPGLFGRMRIAPAAGNDALVPFVESDAVIPIDGRRVVFVPLDEEGVFEARTVRVGTHDEERTEIRDGLKPGERYVADGAFVLKSELQRNRLGGGHAH